MLVIFVKKQLTSLRKLQEQKGFLRLPLKKLTTGHYQVCASVNGKKGLFIIDTGASNSCIGFNAISYFNLTTKSSNVKAAGAGAIDMETKITENNLLKLGSLKLQKTHFVVFDLVHVNEALKQVNESPINGIIGADLLKQLHAIIDYGRNCMYLKK